MVNRDDNKYFKILEIDQSADAGEIKAAYLRLKRLYSGESPVVQAVVEEFPVEKKQEILVQIEEAFRRLYDPAADLENERLQKIANADTLPEVFLIPEDPPEPLVEQPETATDSPFPGDFRPYPVSPESPPPLLEKIVSTTREKAPSTTADEHTIPATKGEDLENIRRNLGLTLEDISAASGIPTGTLKNIEADHYDAFPDAGHLRWCVGNYARQLSLSPRETADSYMKHYRQWKRVGD